MHHPDRSLRAALEQLGITVEERDEKVLYHCLKARLTRRELKAFILEDPVPGHVKTKLRRVRLCEKGDIGKNLSSI